MGPAVVVTATTYYCGVKSAHMQSLLWRCGESLSKRLKFLFFLPVRRKIKNEKKKCCGRQRCLAVMDVPHLVTRLGPRLGKVESGLFVVWTRLVRWQCLLEDMSVDDGEIDRCRMIKYFVAKAVEIRDVNNYGAVTTSNKNRVES